MPLWYSTETQTFRTNVIENASVSSLQMRTWSGCASFSSRVRRRVNGTSSGERSPFQTWSWIFWRNKPSDEVSEVKTLSETWVFIKLLWLLILNYYYYYYYCHYYCAKSFVEETFTGAAQQLTGYKILK